MAETGANVFRQVADGIGALVTRTQQLDAIRTRIYDLTSGSGLDQFNAKIREVNASLPFYAGKLQELTPAQYAFANSLINTGTAADVAIKKATDLGNSFQYVMTTLDRRAVQVNIANLTSADSFDTYSAAALRASQADATGTIFATQVAKAIADKRITVEQGTQALLQYATSMEVSSAAQQQHTSTTIEALQATQVFTQELNASALEAVNASIQTEALKLRQEELSNAAVAAAQGMGATAQSAAVLAQQFSITTAQAYGLISAMQQLEVAKAKKDTGISPKDYDSNALYLQAVKEAEATQKAYEARQQYNYSVADTAGKLAFARQELDRTTKGTAEYWQAQTKVAALEKQINAERNRGGGAPKLTPNEKLNVGLLDQLDKFNTKYEDAERDHYKKLEQINADYNKKVEAQERQNQVSKRRSRASFYENLANAEGVDTSKFAAMYEQAFAEAQQIAQSGKAKLAEEFLSLRQKQIEELKQLDEDAAKIRQDQKDGKLDKVSAQAQLDYLEGRRKLIQDAQQEELNQLRQNGDAYQNELNDKLTAEEERYAEQADKISTSSERAANAKIQHAERSKIAVDAENKALVTQANLYDRIAAKNGGIVPTGARQPSIKNTDVGNTTDQQAVPIDTKNPIPITADILTVQQSDIFLVRDIDVYNAISDLSSRIDSRLGEVIAAIITSQSTLSSAISAVEKAVNRARSTTTTGIVQP